MLEQISFPFASLSVPAKATGSGELTTGPAHGDHHHVNRSSWTWWIILISAVLAGIYYWWYTQTKAAKELLVEPNQNKAQITPLVQI